MPAKMMTKKCTLEIAEGQAGGTSKRDKTSMMCPKNQIWRKEGSEERFLKGDFQTQEMGSGRACIAK